MRLGRGWEELTSSKVFLDLGSNLADEGLPLLRLSERCGLEKRRRRGRVSWGDTLQWTDLESAHMADDPVHLRACEGQHERINPIRNIQLTAWDDRWWVE